MHDLAIECWEAIQLLLVTPAELPSWLLDTAKAS